MPSIHSGLKHTYWSKLLLNHFFLIEIDLQCCVNFYTAKWSSYTRTYIYFFPLWFSIGFSSQCYRVEPCCLSIPYLIEKTPMLEKTGGRRRRGWQRMRWWDSITDSTDMNLSKLWQILKDREPGCAATHRVIKSWTQLSRWTTNVTSYIC